MAMKNYSRIYFVFKIFILSNIAVQMGVKQVILFYKELVFVQVVKWKNHKIILSIWKKQGKWHNSCNKEKQDQLAGFLYNRTGCKTEKVPLD